MSRKSPVSVPDGDNPEWTDDDFGKAKPAAEILPSLYGRLATDALIRKRGRPAADKPKVLVTLRLDADIVSFFRAQGAGWQTRLNAELKRLVTSSDTNAS